MMNSPYTYFQMRAEKACITNLVSSETLQSTEFNGISGVDRNSEKQMVQAQYSETFLKGEDVKLLGITNLKILDEGSYVKGNYGEQLQVRVLANDKDKKKFKWSLSSKANDTLITLFGKDTAEWVGKTIEITTENNKSGNASVTVKTPPQGKLGV